MLLHLTIRIVLLVICIYRLLIHLSLTLIILLIEMHSRLLIACLLIIQTWILLLLNYSVVLRLHTWLCSHAIYGGLVVNRLRVACLLSFVVIFSWDWFRSIHQQILRLTRVWAIWTIKLNLKVLITNTQFFSLTSHILKWISFLFH